MQNILLRVMSVLLLIVFATSLSGCYIKQRRMDYLYSHATHPLYVPPCASNVNVGSDCIIPPVAGSVPCQPVSIIPPGSCARE